MRGISSGPWRTPTGAAPMESRRAARRQAEGRRGSKAQRWVAILVHRRARPVRARPPRRGDRQARSGDRRRVPARSRCPARQGPTVVKSSLSSASKTPLALMSRPPRSEIGIQTTLASLQLALQPSPPVVSPSSHASAATGLKTLSPHTGSVQSWSQVAVSIPPDSHCSPGSIFEFPHRLASAAASGIPASSATSSGRGKPHAAVSTAIAPNPIPRIESRMQAFYHSRSAIPGHDPRVARVTARETVRRRPWRADRATR